MFAGDRTSYYSYSAHEYRKHQEGTSEQFGVEAIGITEVARDYSDTHQRVGVLLPAVLEGEPPFARYSSTCCEPHTTSAPTNSECSALSTLVPKASRISPHPVYCSLPSPVLCHLWPYDVFFPEYAVLLLQLEATCKIEIANLQSYKLPFLRFNGRPLSDTP